jgi:hypothetical protein
MGPIRHAWAASIIGATLGAFVIGTGVARAQNKEQPTGGFDLSQERDRELYQRYAERADIKVDDVRPMFTADRVSHVANGVALRNRSRGYIHSRGVPAKSTVVRSFLLWNLSDSEAVGKDTMPVLFDGNVVPGRKTADNTDPCWGRGGNHSYIADVTAYTNQAAGSNQDYEVTLPFTEGTSTTGASPWTSADSAKTLLEGASLVVIFQNEKTVGSLALFAPQGDNMFLSSATYVLPSPGLGAGLFTMIGGDGQRGFGHTNFASNELTFFDGTQIAGPPIAASDWDGSDGLTLPQLWDTHTHEVKFANPSSVIDYTQTTDCLVAVGFVLDQE